MCTRWGEVNQFIGDTCILKYTVVMYHLITNDEEIYLYSILFFLMIFLYGFQCSKIRRLIKSYTNSKRDKLEFQIILIILSILRIFLISHGVFGYVFDINNTHIENTIYCEHIITKKKCSQNYIFYGFFQEFIQLLMNITVQLFSVNWQLQILPTQIKQIYHQERKHKAIILILAISDFINLILIIITSSKEMARPHIRILFYYEIYLSVLTYLYFTYVVIKYFRVNQKQSDYIILGISITLSIIVRLCYITLRLCSIEDDEITEHKKNIPQWHLFSFCIAFFVNFLLDSLQYTFNDLVNLFKIELNIKNIQYLSQFTTL